MELPSSIIMENAGDSCKLLRAHHTEPFKHASWERVEIPGLKHFVALSLHTHFVTSPTFGYDLSRVPGRTQFLLWEEANGFGVLLPLLHEDFRSEIAGVSGGIEIKCSCSEAGRERSDVVVALSCLRSDPYQAIRDGVKQAVDWMGRGKLRTDKTTPDWINHLGWCTWDAFYADVNEDKIIEGLTRFKEGGIVPGQMIIDEGWQDYSSKHFLLSYGVKKDAFTNDSLQTVIQRAKVEFGLKWVGCWRTLFGELRGVDVNSQGFGNLKRDLVIEPGTPGDLFGVVESDDVPRFHEDYAARVAAEGVDFLKVDFQSALHNMTYGQIGRAEGARIWQHSVQDSVEKHFNGQMLNCMAMGSDEVYHTRTSNVCRASDDFFPGKDDSHAHHVRQNLYNSLWLSEVQWPDWDMFQSGHPWALYHAMARAISGGPVYVSDKPGASDYRLLKCLVAADGHVLRCQQPALPTRDMLFVDPMQGNRPLKAFNRCRDIGMLGLFHPSTDPESPAIEEKVSAWQVEGMGDLHYAVYSITNGFLGVFNRKQNLSITLSPRNSDLLIFSPLQDGFAVLGLIDKLNPAACILEQEMEEKGCQLTLRGGGRFGFFSSHEPKETLLDGLEVSVVQETGIFYVDTGLRRTCNLKVIF